MNVSSQIKIAGHVSRNPLNLSIKNISKNATVILIKRIMYAARDATSQAFKLVKAAGVVTGIPIVPYESPVILAAGHESATLIGSNPSPIKIIAVIATDAPNPAAIIGVYIFDRGDISEDEVLRGYFSHRKAWLKVVG